MSADIGSFKPWDVIATPGFASERIYLIEAICHGGQVDSGVEMSPMDKGHPMDTEGKRTFFVPIEMLCAGINAGVFKHQPTP